MQCALDNWGEAAPRFLRLERLAELRRLLGLTEFTANARQLFERLFISELTMAAFRWSACGLRSIEIGHSAQGRGWPEGDSPPWIRHAIAERGV